jgi:hypothetical protein
MVERCVYYLVAVSDVSQVEKHKIVDYLIKLKA